MKKQLKLIWGVTWRLFSIGGCVTLAAMYVREMMNPNEYWM